MMDKWTGLGAALLLAPAAALLAQGPAPAEQAPYRMVWVAAVPADPLSEGPLPDGMIRRAVVTAGDVPRWLDESDAPIAAWRKTEEEGSALFLLDFDGAGSVSGCRALGVSTYNPAPLAWARDLCPVVTERARIKPALRRDGKAMPDQVHLYIQFKTNYTYGPRVGPLIQLNLPAPISVSQTNPSNRLGKWPPSRDWLQYSARLPRFSGNVEQAGGKIPRGPQIGVEIADPLSGDPACRVVRSSGKPALDARACDHVEKALKPQWATEVRYPVRRWALLMVPSGKGFRVIAADPKAWRPLVPQAGERARLEELWRGQANGARAVSIEGDVSAEGRGINCIIQRTSGSDAADVAACRLFIEEARFDPERDTFGQIVAPGRILYVEFAAQ